MLLRVGLVHGLLVVALAAALSVAGLPVKGALLGGTAMAFSLAFLFVLARAVAVGSKSAVAVLASLKTFAYLGLVTAALTGRLVADGGGFAAGVSCFVLASLIVVLAGGPAKRTA